MNGKVPTRGCKRVVLAVAVAVGVAIAPIWQAVSQTLSPVPKRVLFIYTSNDPKNMYGSFAPGFTKRVHDEKIFTPEVNDVIRRQWIQLETNGGKSQSPEGTMKALVSRVKKAYESGKVKAGIETAEIALDEARSSLAGMVGPSPSYPHLLFWSAANLFDQPERLSEPALLYATLASDKQQKELGDEVSPKVISAISTLSQGKQMVEVNLSGGESCDFFVDGRSTGRTLSVVAEATHVFSARCSDGVWSKMERITQAKTISVKPVMSEVLVKMPAIKNLPTTAIQKLGVDATVLIHWASLMENSYIRCVVLKEAGPYVLDDKTFKMPTSEQSNAVGDNLIEFLRYQAKTLNELPQ